MSSSALISQALDSQVSELNVQGGLLDVMKAVESQTGVRIEAAPAVWDALPWGQETNLTVHVKNTTVRRVMEIVTKRLGLTFSLGAEAVELEPSGALSRLGRRATLDEIRVLDVLASNPIELNTGDATVEQVLQAVDGKLVQLKSPFAVQDRAFDSAGANKSIHVARNATLMDAMEEIAKQTDATWYPWGHSLVLTSKIDATRLLLAKRITRQYRDVELPQVLTELAEYCNVSFTYEPGVLQQVPGKYQHVTLTLDDATVEQVLEIISGATGLKFTATGAGVNVSFAGIAPR